MNLDKEYIEKLRELAEKESVYRPTPVTDEPVTSLYQWMVYTVELPGMEGNTIHFVGWTGWEGRVSSAIQAYDPTTKEGVSRSGRIYKLEGHSGYNSDAVYVWATWKQMNAVQKWNNVTDDYEANPVS